MIDAGRDPNEPRRTERARRWTFAFVVILSTIVLGIVMVAGPLFADPESGEGPVLVYAVPALIALAFAATIGWLVIQKRGR